MTADTKNDVRVFYHLGCKGILVLAGQPDRFDWDEESKSLAVGLRCSRCRREIILVFFEQDALSDFEQAADIVEQQVAEVMSETTQYVAERLAFQAMQILDEEEQP